MRAVYVGRTDGFVSIPTPSGIVTPCLLVFVTRLYGTTRIRERNQLWIGEKYADCIDNAHDEATERHMRSISDSLEIILHGESPPNPGGLFEDRGRYSEVMVYCNDLVLCPQCGRFIIRKVDKIVQTLLAAKSDAAKLELLELRRNVPEFVISKCDLSDCFEFGKDFRRERGIQTRVMRCRETRNRNRLLSSSEAADL